MQSLTDQELFTLAKKRVEDKRGFMIHLLIYLIFAVINFATLLINQFKWEYIVPLLGWGIGIIIHYFSLHSFLNAETAIQKEIKLIKKRSER